MLYDSCRCRSSRWWWWWDRLMQSNDRIIGNLQVNVELLQLLIPICQCMDVLIPQLLQLYLHLYPLLLQYHYSL